MSYNTNPNKLITDREGIIAIIEQGRLSTVVITASLSATGRTALEKFLRYYVQDKYAKDALIAWSDKAEAQMRCIAALKEDPVLTAEAHQTVTGEPESMYIKWNYFYWYVEPKEGFKVHPYDRQVKKRIIEADAAERAAKPPYDPHPGPIHKHD